MSFYVKGFRGSKKKHADWLVFRKNALKRNNNISIRLKNIKIIVEKDTAYINFTQIYKSDSYSDIGIKEIVFSKNEKEWKIISEVWQSVNKSHKIANSKYS